VLRSLLDNKVSKERAGPIFRVKYGRSTFLRNVPLSARIYGVITLKRVLPKHYQPQQQRWIGRFYSRGKSPQCSLKRLLGDAVLKVTVKPLFKKY
jgi:hypothetical protein